MSDGRTLPKFKDEKSDVKKVIHVKVTQNVFRAKLLLYLSRYAETILLFSIYLNNGSGDKTLGTRLSLPKTDLTLGFLASSLCPLERIKLYHAFFETPCSTDIIQHSDLSGNCRTPVETICLPNCN